MSFVNPAFLWALPLLGIPIALHMMQWQVPRPIVFPSIRFIKKASDADRGKRGLRDLLTLLARLCLMALIILLLAGPKTPDVPLTPSEDDGSRTLVFIDLSASMAAVDFKKALDEAFSRVAKEAKPGLFMALGSADGVVKRSVVTEDPKQLTTLTADWKPTFCEGRHASAAAEASVFLAGNRSSTCYVLSDFQASDWSAGGLKTLSRTSELVPIAVASTLDDNVAIIGAESSRLARGKDTVLHVSATLRNFSISSKPVSLTCRQERLSTTESLTLAGGETRRVDLHLPKASGSRTELSLEGPDSYAPDNALWIWTGPRPAIPLALLGGRRDGGDLGRFFLGHALTVRQPGHLRLEVFPDGDNLLVEGQLDRVRAVAALNGFRDSGPFELRQVADWVTSGGTLICFAGDGFVNGLASLNTEGICGTRPGIVHGDRANLESFFLGQYDSASPVLKPFADAGLSFDSFPVFRYVGLTPPEGATTLMQFESGDPFLIRERLGKGSVFLFATGLSQRWSEFATSRQFLPLVRRLIESSVHADSGADHTTCRSAATLESLNAPGIVTIERRPTVVNVSRLESNPDMLDAQAIAHELELEGGDESGGVAAIPGQDLTFPFAVAVIIFLLLELIVANANATRVQAKEEDEA